VFLVLLLRPKLDTFFSSGEHVVAFPHLKFHQNNLKKHFCYLISIRLNKIIRLKTISHGLDTAGGIVAFSVVFLLKHSVINSPLYTRLTNC
jgi:hypothetical protein